MRFIRPDSLWRQLFAEAELHVVRQAGWAPGDGTVRGGGAGGNGASLRPKAWGYECCRLHGELTDLGVKTTRSSSSALLPFVGGGFPY